MLDYKLYVLFELTEANAKKSNSNNRHSMCTEMIQTDVCSPFNMRRKQLNSNDLFNMDRTKENAHRHGKTLIVLQVI